MSLENLVRVFNALPRSPKTPSNLIDNHWQFGIQHISLKPSGDLLHIVNPGSLFNHTQGPAQILSETTPEAQADVALPLLLTAFTSGAGTENSPTAPWSWGTNDAVFANALEGRLKAAGVREELCKIEVGNEALISIQQAEWEKLFAIVKKQAGPRCTKCKKQPDNLKLCSGCKTASYCSRECQRTDWKAHKVICKFLGKEVTSTLDPLEYYETVAPNLPNAQRLARGIGLKFVDEGGPSGFRYVYRQISGSSTPRCRAVQAGCFRSLMQSQLHTPDANILSTSYPIRRLVVTGKDTPENFSLIFGQPPTKEIKKTQKDQRMEALLRPPPGSPDYVMSSGLQLDIGCPPWTPREPSPEEQLEVTKVRNMQALITSHMGARGVKNIKPADMQQILVSNFGADWVSALGTYQTALNAMDQDVRV